MNIFTPLRMEKVDGTSHGRQLWMLQHSLQMRLNVESGGAWIRVPKGYVTDLASVPRLLRWLVPPDGPWREPAIIHDFLCGQDGCSRFLADAYFREAMFHLGVPVWRRVSMFYAVRCYGSMLSLIGWGKKMISSQSHKLWHIAYLIAAWSIIALAIGAVWPSTASGQNTCPDGVCNIGNYGGNAMPTQRGWNPTPAPQRDPMRARGPSRRADLAEVRIVGRCRDGTDNIGSGAIVSCRDGIAYVLTVDHVLRGMIAVEVHLDDGRRFRASIIGSNRLNDLATLKIQDPKVGSIDLAATAPRVGETVCVAGYQYGKVFAQSAGTVVKYVAPDTSENYSFIETTCHSVDGQSGGPIYNSRGQIVGVITGNAPKAIGPCLPLLRHVLEKLLPPYPKRPGNLVPNRKPLVPVGRTSPAQVSSGVAAAMSPGSGGQDSKQPPANEPETAATAQSLPAVEVAEDKALAIPELKQIRDVARTVAAVAVTEKGPEIAATTSPFVSSVLSTALVSLGVSFPVAYGMMLLGKWLAKRGVKRIAARKDGGEGRGYVSSLPHPIDPPPKATSFAGGRWQDVRPVLIPGQEHTETVYVHVPTADPNEEAKRRAERLIAMSDPHAAVFFAWRDDLAKSQLNPSNQ